MTRRPRRLVLEVLSIIAVALVVSFLLKSFVFQSFYVPSPSMENTLEINDRVLVPVWNGSATDLKRGDVIVFRDPDNWLDITPSPPNPVTSSLAFLGVIPPDGSGHLVKRIIGLPGDTVACCGTNGELVINGTPISEPYVQLSTSSVDADPYTFSIQVPKGMLLVLGDNRFNSADSAYRFAHHDQSYLVPESDVVGRATLISWPLNRWQALQSYPSTFAPIGHPQPTVVPQG